MAKTKKRPRGRPVTTGGMKPIILQVRGEEPVRDWIKGLAKANKSDVSKTAMEALELLAEQIGYEEELPAR
jgi:hypothetical protein